MERLCVRFIDFTKESIELAGKQQNAVKKLGTSLETAGIHTEGASERLQEYAASLQLVTTYGDETIIEVEAMLATFGATEEVIMDATQATLDMASAMDMDLKAAAILMGKAIAGETGSLSRYGIIVDENELKTRGFAAVLEEVNKKFAGQAQSAAETYSGRLEQMKNRFGDLKETIGFAFMPILTDLMEKVSEGGGLFENLEDWVGKTAEAMGEWFDLNWDNIEEFFRIIQETEYIAIVQGLKDMGSAFGIIIGDNSSGAIGAEAKYQEFVDTVGESIQTLADAMLTIKAIIDSIVFAVETLTGAVTIGAEFFGALGLKIISLGEEGDKEFTFLGYLVEAFKDTTIESFEELKETWNKTTESIEKDAVNSTNNAESEYDGMESSVKENMELMSKYATNFQGVVNSLHGKDITSTHTINTKYTNIGDTRLDFSQLNKQSGGVINSGGFANDLNIPLVKGEAVLPASVVKAIKDNKSSFAGLDASEGGGVVNNFNISELVVREEADIGRVAEELYDMQLTRSRLA